MASLKLTNFSKMSPEYPEYTQKNQHYLISGVDPFYYLAQSAVQEQKAAPLAASRTFIQDANTYFGNIAHAIPSTYSLFDMVLVTEFGEIYGAGNGFVDFGMPVSMNNVGPRIGIFAGNVLMVYPQSGIIFRKPITTPAGSWISMTGALNIYGVGAGIRYFKPFLDFCAVSDNDGSSLNSNHIVRKIDSSWVVTKVLDLGVGWNIQALENLDNRYLAVAASYTGDGTYGAGVSSDINYLFLWNGYGSRYQSAIRIPGIFVDMKSIGTGLYFVILERSNQYSLYILSGNKIVKLFNIASDSVNQVNSLTSGYVLFNYNDDVGINLASKGQLIYDPESKDKYILTPQSFRIALKAGSLALIYGLTASSTSSYSTGYSPISYQSQWIPFKDPKTVVVKYATPPASGDSIQVTLDGYDEDGTASTALALNPITNLTKYNSYKTMLDCLGFKGHLVRVKLSTVSVSGWTPILREIELKN